MVKKTTKIFCVCILSAVTFGGALCGLYFGVPSVKSFVDNLGQNTEVSIEQPKAPNEADIKTDTKAISITVKPIENAEYSLDGEIWQNSNVFEGLEPNTTYRVSIRFAQNGTTPPSAVTTIEVTTSKYTSANAPTLEIEEITPDKIVIDSTDNRLEYSLNGVDYQDSIIFENLTPNTSYDIYIRFKETSTSYASKPTIITYITPKYEQQEVPTVTQEDINISANSINLPNNENYEYSLDSIVWQNNGNFENLQAGTTYTVFIRYTETATHYAGSEIMLSITTNKYTQNPPTLIGSASVTDNTINAPYIEGAEYSLDCTIWQDSNIFEELNYNTEYTIYIRYKENSTYYSSDFITTTIQTGKEPQSAPFIEVVGVTLNSIELELSTGAEYSLNKQDWYTSPIIENLDFNTTYTIYARFPETDTKLESDIVSVTVKTADKQEQERPVSALYLSSSDDNYIELENLPNMEYAISTTDCGVNYSNTETLPDEMWTDNPKFTNLTSNTYYYVFWRIKETESLKASLPAYLYLETTPKIYYQDIGYIIDKTNKTAKVFDYNGNGGVAEIFANIQFNDTAYTVTRIEGLSYNLRTDENNSEKRNITELTIPSTINSIHSLAFANLYSLSKVYFNAVQCEITTESTPVNPFLNAGIYSKSFEIIIGETVERIPNYLCSNEHLTKVTILDDSATKKYISNSAFYQCNNLETFVINLDENRELYEAGVGQKYYLSILCLGNIANLKNIYITDSKVESAKTTDIYLRDFADKIKPLSEYIS